MNKEAIQIYNNEERKNLLINQNNKIVQLKIINTIKKNRKIRLLSLIGANSIIIISSINKKFNKIAHSIIVRHKVLIQIMKVNLLLI